MYDNQHGFVFIDDQKRKVELLSRSEETFKMEELQNYRNQNVVNAAAAAPNPVSESNAFYEMGQGKQ